MKKRIIITLISVLVLFGAGFIYFLNKDTLDDKTDVKPTKNALKEKFSLDENESTNIDGLSIEIIDIVDNRCKEICIWEGEINVYLKINDGQNNTNLTLGTKMTPIKTIEVNNKKYTIQLLSATPEEANLVVTQYVSNSEDKTVFTSGKIQYAYGYGIDITESLNKINNDKNLENFINILEIDLNSEQITAINLLIKPNKFIKYNDDDCSLYKKCLTGISGIYQVILDDVKLSFDYNSDFALYENDGESYFVVVPQELTKNMIDIINDNIKNDKLAFTPKKITITGQREENKDVSLVIEDKIRISEIIDDSYNKKVFFGKDEMINEEYEYALDFDNGITLYLFYASKIGYLCDSNIKDCNYVTLFGGLDYTVANIISDEFDTLN